MKISLMNNLKSWLSSKLHECPWIQYLGDIVINGNVTLLVFNYVYGVWSSMSRGGNLSRTTRKVVLAYARCRARRAYIRLLVWWYTRPCHSFNVRRTMLYGRRYVKVVETVEGNGVVHHSDVDSSLSILSS
jgi:hypothetical protein